MSILYLFVLFKKTNVPVHLYILLSKEYFICGMVNFVTIVSLLVKYVS